MAHNDEVSLPDFSNDRWCHTALEPRLGLGVKGLHGAVIVPILLSLLGWGYVWPLWFGGAGIVFFVYLETKKLTLGKFFKWLLRRIAGPRRYLAGNKRLPTYRTLRKRRFYNG